MVAGLNVFKCEFEVQFLNLRVLMACCARPEQTYACVSRRVHTHAHAHVHMPCAHVVDA